MSQFPPEPGQPDPEAQEVRALATKGTDFGLRAQGLEQAVRVARGHLDDGLLDETQDAVDRAAGRLRLSATHTVVAIAGATGSGKSSTFNALTGLELSSTGVRRPTTSWATACVWGHEGAAEVLEWLGIPPRHQTMRDSMLDTRHDDKALDGVVLMDLPDHDSTEVAHHLEVDRLVVLADLLVWVLDPQKYADAAIHDRYLAPFKTHQDVMLVVLNHIDTVPEDRRQAMVDDVRRLLALDGLPDVKVIPISARAGIGVDELRAEIAARADAKRSSTARAEADLQQAAERLDVAGGTVGPRELAASDVRQLEEKVAEAAGVPTTVESVERFVRRRAGRAATWPPLALVGGGDPGRETGTDLSGVGRPQVQPVQRTVVDTEIRSTVDRTVDGMAPGWAESVRRSVVLGDVDDRIDAGLARVDLGIDRLPGSIQLLRALQWLLLLGAVGGGVWWALSAFDVVAEAPEVGGYPLPPIVLVACLVLGLLLTLVGRSAAAGAARGRADDVDQQLRRAVSTSLASGVVEPVNAALAPYQRFREGIAAALR